MSSLRSSISPSTSTSPAARLFAAAFPGHSAEREPTSGSGLLCGLRAISQSIRNQHRAIIASPPTIEELLAVNQSDAVQEVNQLLGALAQNNENNFFVDQLGAIVYHWGRQHGHNLRLGYVLGDGQEMLPFLVGTPDDEEDKGPLTVWIASDNPTGISGGGGFDHFTALKRSNFIDLTVGDDDDMESPSSEKGRVDRVEYWVRLVPRRLTQRQRRRQAKAQVAQV